MQYTFTSAGPESSITFDQQECRLETPLAHTFNVHTRPLLPLTDVSYVLVNLKEQ
jgi:hypothetical protein